MTVLLISVFALKVHLTVQTLNLELRSSVLGHYVVWFSASAKGKTRAEIYEHILFIHYFSNYILK